MTRRGGSLGELLDQQRNRIAIILILLVGVYFMVAFGEQAWRARQLQAEEASLGSAIAKIERDNAALQASWTRLQHAVRYVEARADATPTSPTV